LDWFFHDPGQGRVGPLSADDLRTRYRERRIQLDTLVWREGMREWQPLERMADELDLLSVKPDASLPPPLPPVATPAAAYAGPGASMSAGAGYGAARPVPERKGMSGCLIALIVGAVLAVPLIGVLAAIALPAYQGYVDRSKVATQIDARAPAIQAAVMQAMAANNGRCPASAQEAGLGEMAGVDFGDVGGHCAFQMKVQGLRAQLDGKSVVFIAPGTPAGPWDCTGGDLPARYRRPQCRAEDGPTP